MNRYSRRRFLIAAGAAGSAALLGIGVVAKRSFEGALAADLGELLADLEAASKVGKMWLAAHPEQARRDELVAELLAELHLGARLVPPDELWRRITELVHSDYAAARVEQVAGWVLSRTETRLCALASLTAALPAGSVGRKRRRGSGR